MPRDIITTVYTFDELADKAKQRARDWYREHALDYEWWESTIDDAAAVAALLGITLDEQRDQSGDKVQSRRPRPAIYFEGFGCQGNGACLTGYYAGSATAAADIRQYAPLDTYLARIADELAAVQSRYQGHVRATVKEHSGPYYHEYSITIDVYLDDDADVAAPDLVLVNDDATTVADTLRAFMRWIFRRLETEYTYQLSDDVVDETIAANEYTFTLDGRREG